MEQQTQSPPPSTSPSPSTGKTFVKGLAVAMLGGVVTSVTDAQSHHKGVIDPGHIGSVAATGAALGLLTFVAGHINGQSAPAPAQDQGEQTEKVVADPNNLPGEE